MHRLNGVSPIQHVHNPSQSTPFLMAQNANTSTVFLETPELGALVPNSLAEIDVTTPSTQTTAKTSRPQYKIPFPRRNWSTGNADFNDLFGLEEGHFYSSTTANLQPPDTASSIGRFAIIPITSNITSTTSTVSTSYSSTQATFSSTRSSTTINFSDPLECQPIIESIPVSTAIPFHRFDITNAPRRSWRAHSPVIREAIERRRYEGEREARFVNFSPLANDTISRSMTPITSTIDRSANFGTHIDQSAIIEQPFQEILAVKETSMHNAIEPNESTPRCANNQPSDDSPSDSDDNDDAFGGRRSRRVEIRNHSHRERYDKVPVRSAYHLKTPPINHWKVCFSGDPTPVNKYDVHITKFLSLVKCYCSQARIPESAILEQIMHLLAGSALDWYQNECRNIHDWTEFER